MEDGRDQYSSGQQNVASVEVVVVVVDDVVRALFLVARPPERTGGDE